MSCKRAQHTLTDETHERIVELHLLGLSISQIATSAGLPPSTVHTNVTLYKQTSQVHKKHKGGNHTSIISDAVKRLVADLEDADHTL
jgi:DNA-directed RNA polymerase specialized sigma24 family protein